MYYLLSHGFQAADLWIDSVRAKIVDTANSLNQFFNPHRARVEHNANTIKPRIAPDPQKDKNQFNNLHSLWRKYDVPEKRSSIVVVPSNNQTPYAVSFNKGKEEVTGVPEQKVRTLISQTQTLTRTIATAPLCILENEINKAEINGKLTHQQAQALKQFYKEAVEETFQTTNNEQDLFCELKKNVQNILGREITQPEIEDVLRKQYRDVLYQHDGVLRTIKRFFGDF